jgi:3-isopropylmalate/(R)-2-methylmalate dehydratase small subunit
MGVVRGRAWKFGDEINTDMIVAGKYLAGRIEDAMMHSLEAVNPDFAKSVRAGDVVVGGRNFGCGSAREAAPAVLKALGVGVVVAESFARIFFRNAIAVGLGVLSCPGIGECVEEGDVLDVDLERARIVNVRMGKEVSGQPLADEMLKIIKKGGLAELIIAEYGQKPGVAPESRCSE